MMKPKVLITRNLPTSAIDRLRKYIIVEINQKDEVMSRKELVEKIKDKDGLLCLLTDRIDTEVMDAGERLKIIANYAVGYNNIDLKAATERKIAVTNTPGVLTETTADLVFALLLAVARRVVEADGFLRRGEFKGWSPMLFLGTDVYKKTLGIIGLGRIGKAVAKRARGFAMRIIYYEPQRLSPETERAYSAEYRPLNELLKEADFITIHTPLTDSTHHLIGEEQFSLMKKSAYLINTSRGPVVDEKALVRALHNKLIAGCGLDVYEQEPAVEEELLQLPNVVLLPHIGSASVETRTRMAEMAVENLVAFFVNHKKPPQILNPEVFE